MVNNNSQSLEEDIKRLAEETKALAQENYHLLRKIHRHLLWDQVMSVVKILLIVVPMILAYFYLAPMLKGVFSTYGNLLGITGMGGDSAVNIPVSADVKDIPAGLLQQLKDSGTLEQYLQKINK